MVLVAPGTYFERIDFFGKAITVTSSDGPKKTIIDGGRAYYPVVNFDYGETRDPVLSGFTLQTKVYAPTANSPAVDAGVKTSVSGGSDVFGHKRRVDGNGDDRKVIDLGAIEFGAR